MSVTSQPGDNAHRIFESLNNTGLKLTQGDLLRNYLFMRLPTQADAVYQSLWLPLQSELSAEELELLFWLDLVQEDPKITQSETYARQQARLDRLKSEDEIKAEVDRFARLGRLLRLIRTPSRETDPALRLRLTRLKAWGTTTVSPLLLHLLDRRDNGTISSETVTRCLLYVESYLVRRLLIGRATAGINRTLLGAVPEISPQDDVAEALHRYLSVGRKYYATDADVATAVTTVPFFHNGRSNQRKLVLQWLEESFGSKEPVDPKALTVEHVMPQTPTDAWRSELAPDLDGDERFEEVHQALQHTLGNLTLTGYNSSLSNSPFTKKKELLATSGLRMNQEIAAVERWGRIAVLDRATALAQRIATIWPAPLDVPSEPLLTPAWKLLARAVAELPPGAWTSYGDLAALIGSHAVPVGVHIASHPIDNGHRVMQSGGAISPGFRWYEPDRQDDPVEVLKSEGVEFDDQGRAKQAQRFTADDLAALLGEEYGELPGEMLIPAGQDEELRDKFVSQLSEGTGPTEAQAMLSLVSTWSGLGGEVSYGTASQTSCFLGLRLDQPDSIWMAAIYPTGLVEIVFQWLAPRPPFDDIHVRDELRERLNQIPSVEIPAAKLALRPNIRATYFTSEGSLQQFAETSAWFLEKARSTAPPLDGEGADG